MYRRVTIYVLMCLTIVSLCSSEIHRAKSGSVKHAVKREYVAGSLKVDTNTERPEFGDMVAFKYDTWCYSIFGAMLVGLSGIFPLLVIPIEAGPSLKHGGRFPFLPCGVK